MSYIVPIGPYHPALEEPIHAKLYTEGEVIKDAEVFVGYNHRGIEKLATERNAIQTLVLVERVCGICSHSHALTYAMCVENINGIEVPKRGQYIRVITAELERLHSHFLWLGIACHIIGHDSMFMHIWDERELVMDLLEKMTGNRVNYAMVTVGGARRDIDDELRRELLEACDKLKAPLDRITEIALTDKTIAMRTKGVGVLPKEDALRMGAVGPHARASGVKVDVRKDAPYSSYEDFDFDVPVVESGDVFARVVVRALECYESIKIIRQALENLPATPINLGNKLINCGFQSSTAMAASATSSVVENCSDSHVTPGVMHSRDRPKGSTYRPSPRFCIRQHSSMTSPSCTIMFSIRISI